MQRNKGNDAQRSQRILTAGYTEEKAGWTEYTLRKRKFTLPDEPESIIYFAFGISATWETQRTYWIDYLAIKIDENIFSKSSTSKTSSGFEYVSLPIIGIFFFSFIKRKKITKLKIK